jgi:nuclear pore complex protein Nup98-Nup96
LAKSTKGMGAELISYDSSSGVWKFRVPHFSRYALVDDSDDEDDDMEVVVEKVQPGSQNFETGERGGRSPQQVGASKVAAGTMDVGTSWFGAFRGEDEDTVDVMLRDGGDSNVIRAAENAYKMMSTSVAKDRVQQTKQKSILKKQKKKEKRQKEDSCLFADEGIVVDGSALYSVPVPPSEGDLVISSRPGICARIARKCGVQSFSGSSTDYGMRMGRSFRVGWKPDGSFLHLQSGSAVVLQQSRPVFTDGTVSIEESAKLLETHLINSTKTSSTLRECPSFCLAPTDGGKLRKALSDYVAASSYQEETDAADPEEGLVLMRAFSLLLSLFTKENSGGSNVMDVAMIEGANEGKARAALAEKERIDACVEWLTAACAEDVRNDIREALKKNDVHSAIFAASTGGDIEQACAIATEHGYLHLASLLAAGAAAFDLIRDQVQQWNESGAAATIPAELLRLYTILGGDLSAEEQIHLRFAKAAQPPTLDWRRRLCMLLTFGVLPDDEATLASVVERYGIQVKGDRAPYPCPRYMWNTNIVEENGPQSLLYKILDLARTCDDSDTETKSLARVIAPSGYTPTISDYAGSFHVAAAISALGVGASLSPVEQARLLDGYAAQLTSSGRWDLAVYVMLCSFGIDRPEDLVLREQIAKAIVLNNCPVVPEGETISKRAELESIGVPTAWFEEALAYRCGNNGDSFDYVKHLSAFSPEQARRALEELVVPNMLFMNKADVRHSLELVAAFSWDDDSLVATVVDFFQLAEDIMAVSRPEFDQERKGEEIAALSDMAEGVKTRLRAHRSYNDEIQDASSSLRVVPSYRVVPTPVFLAEALSGVSFLQLQLSALAAGGTIWDDAYLRGVSSRPLKVASELACISLRNDDVSNDSDAPVDSPTLLDMIM